MKAHLENLWSALRLSSLVFAATQLAGPMALGQTVEFVGDSIFAGSMGRGNQSWELARQKVREQILTLPPDTLVCPGHGPLTTVAEEKEHNPFF